MYDFTQQNLPFTASPLLTLGVELELQLVDPLTYDLIGRALELLRHMRQIQKKQLHSWVIRPEITQSMIEINSSIHEHIDTLKIELTSARDYLTNQANILNVLFSGGGTHPFQKWGDRQILNIPRYKNISAQYGYLAKRFTVFGQHIHIGCRDGDEALYLCHALARFLPHFIALSASSPFYQGIDTYFNSSRVNVVNSFPLSGHPPFIHSWEEFARYFSKLTQLHIVSSIKDFYWDIRPKPEFGTVEIRVCDTPLTIEHAVLLTAYAQALSRYILLERPLPINEDIYLLYNHNRFQASRYGFYGKLINPYSLESTSISNDILKIIELIMPHAQDLNIETEIAQVKSNVKKRFNGARWLRQVYKRNHDLKEVVKSQCEYWMGALK